MLLALVLNILGAMINVAVVVAQHDNPTIWTWICAFCAGANMITIFWLFVLDAI